MSGSPIQPRAHQVADLDRSMDVRSGWWGAAFNMDDVQFAGAAEGARLQLAQSDHLLQAISGQFLVEIKLHAATAQQCRYSGADVHWGLWPQDTGEKVKHLQAAMDELGGAVDEAREEEFQEPSKQAIENARRLITVMQNWSLAPVEVYPTREGDIAIYAPGGDKRSVEMLCEAGGSAMCLVNLNGRHRRAIYDSAEMLPDGFLREALAEIDER